MVSERRMARAMRDGYAYEIAEAVAEGRPAPRDAVAGFRHYRKQHRHLVEEEVARRAKKEVPAP